MLRILRRVTLLIGLQPFPCSSSACKFPTYANTNKLQAGPKANRPAKRKIVDALESSEDESVDLGPRSPYKPHIAAQMASPKKPRLAASVPVVIDVGSLEQPLQSPYPFLWRSGVDESGHYLAATGSIPKQGGWLVTHLVGIRCYPLGLKIQVTEEVLFEIQLQNGAPLFVISNPQHYSGLTPEGCFDRYCHKEGRSAANLTAQEFFGFT